MDDIRFLKNLGHQLLDEYISLNVYLGTNAEKRHAYTKLARKLKYKQSAHFSMMNNREEVVIAIEKIRKMIEKRKNMIDRLGLDKRAFAPNLQELQKNIKFEKIG